MSAVAVSIETPLRQRCLLSKLDILRIKKIETGDFESALGQLHRMASLAATQIQHLRARFQIECARDEGAFLARSSVNMWP